VVYVDSRYKDKNGMLTAIVKLPSLYRSLAYFHNGGGQKNLFEQIGEIVESIFQGFSVIALIE
jgi:hypothetical protein